MTAAEKLLSLCVTASQNETLRKLTFSKPLSNESPERITARLSVTRGKHILACEESYAGGKVRHTAASFDELDSFLSPLIAAYGQINLSTGAGDAEFRRSKKGKETLFGAAPLEKKLAGEKSDFEVFVEGLDRQKNYLLTGKEPFLIYLGISDETGRVHDKKQGKYRQINRFLEHVETIWDVLPTQGLLHVYDLCCGKSYLSFAVYYYLHEVRGREVDMLCMDLKEDVIRDCAAIARAVGFTGMRFLAGDIRKTPRDTVPDLVISLHACDIATDIVLDTAAELGAKVILSTPCCHRYLNDRLKMPALDFVARYPHLRVKLCEALTEGIRLARLRAAGYTVAALEMTDPDDTPKNTLLRAVKRGDLRPDSAEAIRLREEYTAILQSVLGDNAGDYLKEIRQ
jgi:SAM-dependent methyltransferase